MYLLIFRHWKTRVTVCHQIYNFTEAHEREDSPFWDVETYLCVSQTFAALLFHCVVETLWVTLYRWRGGGRLAVCPICATLLHNNSCTSLGCCWWSSKIRNRSDASNHHISCVPTVERTFNVVNHMWAPPPSVSTTCAPLRVLWHIQRVM